MQLQTGAGSVLPVGVNTHVQVLYPPYVHSMAYS